MTLRPDRENRRDGDLGAESTTNPRLEPRPAGHHAQDRQGPQVGGGTLDAPSNLVLDAAAAELATLTQDRDLVDLMIVAEYSAASG